MLSLGCPGQTVQFLPEIGVYYKLQSNLRLQFQVKETREGGDPTQAEIGPSIDFYLKPWVKLANATVFDLDQARKRPLIFSVGYRYLGCPDQPSKNRMEIITTANLPLKRKFLLSDRNRADLAWQSGQFSWRYRNRLQAERAVRIGGYHLIPYASVELFYESQYEKWSDTAIYAGCRLPLKKHAVLQPYYEHQNNTGKSPNQQLNQLSLILNLFF
jgi:hypothetical protein